MYLKLCRSSWVMVSALAMTGIKLTLVPSLFIISTSRGLTLLISCAPGKGADSLRSSRLDKVETSMNPQILFIGPVRLLFLPHVRFMLIINEVDNRSPAVDQLLLTLQIEERTCLGC
jgi:hypothetical protein